MSTVAPVITEATYDKTSYAPGDEITVTVHYTPGASESTVAFSGTATDQTTGATGPASGTFTVLTPDPTDIVWNDASGRVYAKESDDGAVAVFKARA